MIFDFSFCLGQIHTTHLTHATITLEGKTIKGQTQAQLHEGNRTTRGPVTYAFALPHTDAVVRGELPATHTTLTLRGARFNPKVYYNRQLIDSLDGGMAPLQTTFKLGKGSRDSLHITLNSLDQVDKANASYIPKVDQWRSNLSSLLWDEATIRTHGEVWIERITPIIDFERKLVKVAVRIGQSNALHPNYPLTLTATIAQTSVNKKLNSPPLPKRGIGAGGEGVYTDTLLLPLHQLQPWTPETPNLYTLTITLSTTKGLSDRVTQPIALKKFEVKDKQFYLNNRLYPVRGATVVWHRWVRNPEGAALGWDTTWFLQNLIRPLKERGANFLRFHLGLPPKVFLDLCDRHGLAVQQEWLFFHGIGASQQSMQRQYDAWLSVADEHPAVCLLQPWNETDDGPDKARAWAALNAVLPHHPLRVLAERDVLHVHKYWWSLFENLGLYYDSYTEFGKAIMVDEFGGNYLDGESNPGGYRTLRESFSRFLGPNHTAAQRLEHHTLANARVAEYWRRIGAAGFTPFCALGSWEDGNHWYLGPLKDGNLKPVWNAMQAAWAPLSVSIDMWDKHHTGEALVPITVYNDLDVDRRVSLTLANANHTTDNVPVTGKDTTINAKAHSRTTFYWRTQLGGMPSLITVSMNHAPWLVVRREFMGVRLHSLSPSNGFGIMADELYAHALGLPEELSYMGKGYAQTLVAMNLNHWQAVATPKEADRMVAGGTRVLLLDAGPRLRGLENETPEGRNLQGDTKLKTTPLRDTVDLPLGVKAIFTEVAEPESHVHFTDAAPAYMKTDPAAGWLWNGMRGGLVAPACEMTLTGLGKHGFLRQWAARGADTGYIIKASQYTSYHLQGYYAYSPEGPDKQVEKALRERVKFLADDAPALAATLNPNAPIETTNLSHAYAQANGQAERITPLVVCGKGLTRTAVALIDYGPGRGKVIISQLFTKERCNPANKNTVSYQPRYDPAAVKLVQDLVKTLMK